MSQSCFEGKTIGQGTGINIYAGALEGVGHSTRPKDQCSDLFWRILAKWTFTISAPTMRCGQRYRVQMDLGVRLHALSPSGEERRR
jgi:hypothetical protein